MGKVVTAVDEAGEAPGDEAGEAPGDDSYVVGKDATFILDDVLINLPKGVKLADYRMIAAARAAGVPLMSSAESKDHVVCPNCGTVVSLDDDRRSTFAGLTRAELAMITNRPRR